MVDTSRENNLKSCSSSCSKGLADLWNTKEHRSSPLREEWLQNWTELNQVDASRPETILVFNSRLKFLQKVWSDKQHFRPFDTIKSSVQYLQGQKDQDFLIRLSTTIPGSITLSFRKEMWSNQIVHTRFTVSSNGNVVDSCGTEHSDVASLALWFSSSKFETSKQNFQPAGYVCIGDLA